MSALKQFGLNKNKELLFYRFKYLATYAWNRNWFSVQADTSEVLKDNPYYQKYSKKIYELKSATPEEFLVRVQENKERRLKSVLEPVSDGTFCSITSAKESACVDNKSSYKTKILGEVMNLDLIEDKSTEEIIQLWEYHHKEKKEVADAIPIELYDMMFERGKKYPVFILPLPRDEGYEFFVCQAADHEVHFTSLINYQAHKENAPECLTAIHYTDLKQKGIVLMHGIFDKNILDIREAQCLINQYQLYYGKSNAKRLKLLEELNFSPSEFKYINLVAELECLYS